MKRIHHGIPSTIWRFDIIMASKIFESSSKQTAEDYAEYYVNLRIVYGIYYLIYTLCIYGLICKEFLV